MFLAFLALSGLLLAAPLPAAQSARAFDPLFDYKSLPPENEELLRPLEACALTMQDAFKVVRDSEGPEARPNRVEFKTSPAGNHWRFELFVGPIDQARPKRVNVQVSTSEPKVLKRLELSTLAPDEVKAWEVMRKNPVAFDIAVDLAVERAKGDKEEVRWTGARARVARFVPEPKAPIWDIELLAHEPKHEAVRRVAFWVNADKPQVKRFVLMDRFPGEPLRNKGQATELEGGLLVYDFVVGDGQELARDAKIKVNYRLFLLDGQKIYDTWETKLPETFLVGEAPLKGMTEGLLGMRVGGRRKIAMPGSLGFGQQGNELAPPDAMIVCDVVVEEIAP